MLTRQFMYGKLFASMYQGSMIGAGPHVFSLMPWIIANQLGGQIEINPKTLAFIFGTTELDVIDAIRFLCAPDPRSRSKEKEGRRIVPMTPTGELPSDEEFQTLVYEVVNWEHYRNLRRQADRREYMRDYMRKKRGGE